MYRRLLFLMAVQLGVIAVSQANVDTVWVMSKAMNKTLPNLVVTPANYDPDGDRLPVLYLLHGAGGNFKQWLNIEPALQQYSDQYNFILVCSDGGNTSWYFDSPVDMSIRYETYVAKELVGFVDGRYRTLAEKRGRAIMGLSMGGHGALYLALRNPGIWGAAGSTSGGLDIRPFPNNWDLAKRLGSYATHPENWEKNTVINMVELLKGSTLKVILDCGTGDFFLEVNRNFRKKLLEQGIPHVYIEMPGGHNAAYWHASLRYHLVFFKSFFNTL
jgi:S-formylglutathione hydrolase FrmB